MDNKYKSIEGIIFDWFGVCTEKWIDVWERELKNKVETTLLRSSFFKYLDKYANNSSTGQEFLENVFSELNLNYKGYEYLLEKHGEVNHRLLGNICKLKKKYKIALLSDNFNDMIPVIKKDIGGFDKYFDVVVLSNELNVGKIENKIYETTLSRLGLEGNSCVFIDDKEKNLVLARTFGIKTILYENNVLLEKDLSELGIVYDVKQLE